MKKKILFMVSSASLIGPLNRKTGNLLTEVAHPQPHSITDGRLITGQNPASAQGVAERVIAVLEASKSSAAGQTR